MRSDSHDDLIEDEYEEEEEEDEEDESETETDSDSSDSSPAKAAEIRRSSDIPEHLIDDTSHLQIDEHMRKFRAKEAEMHEDAQRGAVKMNIFEDKGDVLIKARGAPLQRYEFEKYAAVNFTSLLQVWQI